MARKFNLANPPPWSTKIKLAMGASIAASVGSYLLESLPHTFFIDKFKSIIQMHKLGEPIPVRSDILQLFNTVLDDLKITEQDKPKFEPFVMPGFDLYYAGVISNHRTKAIIGIPFSYTFKDKYSINTTEIRVGPNKEILNIYHPAADDFLDSIVLSEKAQKFGIAREILMSRKNLPLYRSIETPALITSTSCMIVYASLSWNIANKPLLIKMVVYGSIAIAGFATWFQIRDSLNKYFEGAVDKELAELGPDYVEGAKEFYAKLLKKNIANRVLLGKVGRSQYNRDGDEIFFIRNRRTPLSFRLKFFSEIKFPENKTEAEAA